MGTGIDPMGLFQEIFSLTEAQAEELTKKAGDKVAELGLSGFFCIYSNQGLMLLGIALGPNPQVRNMHIATAKIKTVLAMRRSTSVVRTNMEKNGYHREDFAGLLGSLFTGGVAIFSADKDHEFVGTMAFSGGTPEQDEKICRYSIEQFPNYFCHDLTPVPA